jgi:hypothetical protein
MSKPSQMWSPKYNLLACVLSIAVVSILSTQTRAEEVESGNAKTVTNVGKLSITTIVKKKGLECQTGLTLKCAVGKPCFSNIDIDGDAAKQLWQLLEPHGVKSDGNPPKNEWGLA